MMSPSPRKKRKLESPVNSPPLSAIAARRAALQSQAQSRPGQQQKQNGSEVSPKPKSQEEPELFDSRGLGPVLQSYAKARPTVETTLNQKRVVPDEPLLSDDDGASSSSESDDESPEVPNRPSIALSTFKPSKENVKELKNGGLLVRLTPGERLVTLGQYELTVQKGEITLLGATLTASRKSYMVYSPASHSLPVIRCSATDVNNAELCFQSCKSGLESLHGLSPLFGKLWNEDCGPLGPGFEQLLRKQSASTYHMLFQSQNNPPKSYLQPVISPPEWNATLSRLAASESKTQITMICGPKSSGKSTFARLLTNKLLSSNTNAKNQGIALLDLDPGQPEYSIPGNLSLTHLRDPNFGPPYTHPRPSGRGKTLRTHAISAITPSMDPTLYMACASDLHTHYRKLLSTFPKCPLIINTPGWVLGTGLEILVELITKVRPTEVLYMSEEGPREVVENLKEAAKSTPLYTLPSQSSEFTTRTAAHLRTMQYMSYFHLNPTMEGKLSWNNTPLTSLRPWEIKYDGENPGILGVMCCGEQPPPSLLVETINGSLLSLVVVEDTSTILGWQSKDEIQKAAPAKPPPKQVEPQSQDFISLSTTSPIPKNSTNKPTNPHRLLPTPQKPVITPTPESIPYFYPSLLPLPPQSTQTLGLLLVRGIDVPRKRLQVLTSIPPSELQTLNDTGKNVILVSGKLDTPGWAYTEELNLREGTLKMADKEEDSDHEEEKEGEEGKEDLDDAFENVPWVEKLEGSHGRGVGARVWRVRRDLGKSGDGD